MSNFLRLSNGIPRSFAESGGSSNLFSTNDSTFENNSVNNWTRYQDAALFEPVDGTGGTPSANLTFTTTGTNPLHGTYSAILTKSGSANMQGYGVSDSSLPVPISLRGQAMQLDFYYTVVSGTYSSSDLIVRLYDTTNGALIASNFESISTTVTGVAGKFSTQFTCPITCANIRVIIHQATPNTNNYVIAFDDFSLWSLSGISIASPPSASWTGYHDQSVNNWNFDNTSSFADPSSNSSNGNAIVEVDNNNFGTVTTYASGARKLPGFTFTPPAVGRYRVSCTASVVNPPGSGHFAVFQLTDGTTVIDEATAIGSQGGELVMSGIINITSLSSKTIKLQARVDTGSSVISTVGIGQSMLFWSIHSLNSNPATPTGQAASAIYHYDTQAGHGSSATKIPYWTSLVQATDSSGLLVIDNSSTNGFSITATRRCFVSMVWNTTYNSADYAGASKNAQSLTTGISDNTISKPYRITYQYTNANNYSFTVPVSVMLEAGDVLRPHDEGGTTNSNSLNHMYVQAVEITGPKDSTVSALGTSLYTFGNVSGLSSSNTAIPYYTSVVDSIDPNNLLSVVNSSTTGLSVTALKDCTVSMNFPMGYGSSDYKGISLNSNQLSTTIDSITQANRVYQTFSATNVIAHVGTTVPMKAGDVLRPHLATGVSVNGYIMVISAVQNSVNVTGIGNSNSSQSVDNLSLTPSVAGSALTIAMKDRSGIDPSFTSQVNIGMRNSTLSNGTFNLRTVQAATSIVVPSGATLGLESGSNGYIFVYAIDNAGSIEMAVSSMWMDDSVLCTTTAISTSADDNGLYSTTARSNVPFRLIGRFRYSTNPNGTYSAIPDEASLLSSDLFPAATFSNASGSYKTVSGNAIFLAMTGNSITLQPGFYRIDAAVDQNIAAGGITTYIRDKSTYWCTANGADNASSPALITSSSKLVINNLDANNYEAPEWNSQNGDYNFWMTSPKPVYLQVKRTETIYIVPYINAQNATNTIFKTYIQAVQLKKAP